MRVFRSIVLAIFAALPPGVFAVETKSWVHNDKADFEKGTLKNLSLRSDGRLSLAPAFRELFDSSTAYLWALAHDSKGNLYAAGGGPSATTSKLFMIARDGKSRTLAELPGLQVQAIAVDRNDRVYAGTSPDGKVFRVTGDGKHEVFYDPKAKYIWALAFNTKGELFVATGDAGEIHRVASDGKGSIFFRTEETHARSLAVDSKDNLLVGTEPGGLVLRVTPAGEGFVLYQAGKREVTSVAVSSEGAIYAAAVGNRSSSSPALSVPLPLSPAPSPPSGAAPSGGAPPRAAPTPLPSPPASSSSSSASSISGGSEVYRIGTDNYPQRVWSHPQDVVYAIGFDSAGRAIIGTGNSGNIYRIDSDLISTLLINSAPSQITAFTSNGKGGGLYAASGNVGKVYSIGPETEKQGSYESDPLDASFFTSWGRIRPIVGAAGGKVGFETRSGNLDRPQKNWSPWVPVDPASGRVASPSARFIQYRATLSASPDGHSPELHEIEVAYLPKNVPPQLDEIDITPPNYRFPAPSSSSLAAPQTLSLPALGQRRRSSTPPLTLDSLSSSQSLNFAKGYIGARWAVTDPNGDALSFKVEIRGVQESGWKLLRDNIRERFMAWDSTAYPDGLYVVRVTASDLPDNPPDQALSGVIESDPFPIDNTPPQITAVSGTRSGNKLQVRWHAKDAISIIRKAEYSLNGGDWTVVDPSTRLSDSPELDYKISIDAPATGEQTIAVRVTDDYKNQAVDKVVIR